MWATQSVERDRSVTGGHGRPASRGCVCVYNSVTHREVGVISGYPSCGPCQVKRMAKLNSASRETPENTIPHPHHRRYAWQI